MMKRKEWVNKKGKVLKFGILTGSVLSIVLVILVLFQFVIPKNHVITQTSSGFSPKQLTITKGETVTFRTKTEKDYWPASNIHPTHEIYSEFDPKKALKPNEEWSFTFKRSGKWRFHDHLAANYTGVIIVRDENGDIPVAQSSGCKNMRNDLKNQCWDEEFSTVLEEEGVEAAFDLFARIYAEDPEFAGACHGITHNIGKKTYELYSRHVDFQPSINAAYCGYGFYHGFMEALLADSNDIKKAQEFCDFVGEKLGGKSALPKGACFHGIGHGFIEDEPDPENYGDAKKIIAFSLALCEKTGRNEDEKYRCDSGIFNGLAILYSSNKYDLSPNPKDPYEDCRDLQFDHTKKACYEQLNTLVPAVLGFDDGLLAAEAVGAPYNYDAVLGLATYYSNAKMDRDDSEMVRYCRNLRPENQLVCIRGIIGGLLEGGKPEEEYKRVVTFCKNRLLSDEERKICYNVVYWTATQVYSHDKILKICNSFEEGYRKTCEN